MATENTDSSTTFSLEQRPTLDPITTRREIVYLFDATDANPNGDPHTEENRPRIDEDTEEALISDVRQKRTVRDYAARHGHSILVAKSGAERDERDDKDNRIELLQSRMGAYLGGDPESGEFSREELEHAFLAVATDVRLFGDAMAADAAQDVDYLRQYDGAMQIEWARSLHAVRVAHDGKTSVLAADTETQENAGGNMYTAHRVPYALFNSHAVINENAAAETRLSEEDVTLALDALWTGVHELHSSSKSGHQPRLLLSVEFSEGESHIGDLHRDVSLELPDGLEEKALRDIEDATIDLDALLETLAHNADRLESVTGRVHRRVRVRSNGDIGGPQTLINAFEDRLEPEVAVEIERE